MGIASILRRNEGTFDTLAKVLQAHQENQRRQEQQRELASAIAKATTNSRVPTGTTSFGTDASAPFEPLQFQDKQSVDLGSILDNTSQDNPLVGSYLERALLKRKLQQQNQPQSQLKDVDGILYEIPMRDGNYGTPRQLTQPRVKATPAKQPKITTRIIDRQVNGKPVQFERTYRDGVYTGEEVEVGEKPSTVSQGRKPGDLSDTEKQAAEELRAKRKRIADLTARNLEIGQQMAVLSANADADKNGKIDDTEKANLEMLKQSLQNELSTNEGTLDQLNREIGGTWRKSGAASKPAPASGGAPKDDPLGIL